MRKMITLSQSLIDFVNLRKIENADVADEIFRQHSHFIWNRLKPDDASGRASIVDLRNEAEDRLAALVSARKGVRDKILKAVLAELPNASAQANIQGVELPLAVVPVVFETAGRITVKNSWLVTGIHCAVVLGFLELFVDDLIAKLARCAGCENFYLRSPVLRVACSSQCRRKLRIKDVARHVAKYRKEQRRKRERQRRKRG